MRICVIGLGKIGLPLAAYYASRGYEVVGCDVNEQVVAAVNRGESPLAGEPGVAEALAQAVPQGRLRATRNTPAAVAGSQVVIVVVPLLINPDKTSDYGPLEAACRAVAQGLRPGTLVCLETTLAVGDTRGRLGRLLEASGLRKGEGFLLAYSPERVQVNRIFHDLTAYPKLVAGVNEASTRAAAEFYRGALGAPVMELPDTETAEFVKLAECVYRDVNIALANELAMCAAELGVDMPTVIQAANSEPLCFLHQPGIGVGGHCIPVYPYFLINQLPHVQLAALARRVNDGMAAYVVHLLERALGGLAERRVLVLGLGYRADVKEATYSTTLLLARHLGERGATCHVCDPLFAPHEMEALGLRPASLEALPEVDALVLQAYHAQFRELDLGRLQGCRVVVDGRNALDRGRVEALGMEYIGIGRPLPPSAAPEGYGARQGAPGASALGGPAAGGRAGRLWPRGPEGG